jgi:hypothetical protein
MSGVIPDKKTFNTKTINEEIRIMGKKTAVIVMLFLIGCLAPGIGFGAYHHAGESDAPKFLATYPDKAGTKLDHCALCHSGGMQGKKTLGSCQWCHYKYGYNEPHGDILATLNSYGRAYLNEGRSVAALQGIETLDSDSDGYSNLAEIQACRYPGDKNDDPSRVLAPFRVYTKAQLEAMPQHTQFLLMNTSRSGDFYGEYTGVPMKVLLEDAGINLTNAPIAQNIQVYAPDGWAQYHPLQYDMALNMYHVFSNETDKDYQYPPAMYYYKTDADTALNIATGWCDYGAPSCIGRAHGNPIYVDGGLMAILALKREGVDLIPGQLTQENKLDGEGPFRVVVPQKYPNAPDQASTSSTQPAEWYYDSKWDHNAGSCSRTATIIKVEPLPEGTTDINTLESGWSYVDQNKIVIYGNINGSDSNGNGVLDTEEGSDNSDFDNDGVPDYMDPDTAKPRQAKGIELILLHTSKGDFASVSCLDDNDQNITQTGKPLDDIPYGAAQFKITGLNKGESVILTVVFPGNVPTNAKFYKITGTGWTSVPFESNDGDQTIMVTLTDGDAVSDSDGKADGIITDPFALTIPVAAIPEDQVEESSGSASSSLCFISMAKSTQAFHFLPILMLGFIIFIVGIRSSCAAREED